MSYTLEQKREALARGELWWRCPGADYEDLWRWTSVSADLCARDADDEFLCQDGTEYFIGIAAPTDPTHPRVLSELEGELLDALRGCLSLLECHEVDPVNVQPQCMQDARAAIQKAEVQQ